MIEWFSDSTHWPVHTPLHSEIDVSTQSFNPHGMYGNDSLGEAGVPYNARFHMPELPGSFKNMWYSFDFGAVHFVVYSTESDFLPGSEQ